MWPLECCMDEGKAVNWGLANQIFMYKTSTKVPVIGRKESLKKKKTLKQARQKPNTCSVEQYSRKKMNRFSWKSLHIEIIMSISKEKYIPNTVISNSTYFVLKQFKNTRHFLSELCKYWIINDDCMTKVL